MTVLFAESFFASLSALQPRESARAIDFVTRFQANPKHPGISLERLNGRSQHLWSGRISQELRCIILQVGGDWALLHAGHHDAAYQWAERRDVGRHPVTGMIEIVERVETVEEIQRLEEPAQDRALFAEHADDYLLSLGVPLHWLPTLRKVQDDDQLLLVADKLPPDVAERLLRLATGELVTPPEPISPTASPAEHPETRRQFFVAEDSDELRRALEAPLEKWVAFLHPTQRKLAQAAFKGPAKVTGSAGTGKTVVGLHRARHLAREGHRVLLTSFVRTLCENLEQALRVLCSRAELERITVSTIHREALQLVKRMDSRARIATTDTIEQQLRQQSEGLAGKFPFEFVRAEWEAVIQAQGLRTWGEYRQAKRTGRGTPLSTGDRKQLWQVFSAVHQRLEAQHFYDWPGVCRKAAGLLEDGRLRSPFDAVIVDEVQDLGRAELLLVAAMAKAAPERLLLLGDAGQRIYPGGVALSALGIDVRGRSTVLRLNYRTTEQIRKAADGILGVHADDLDGAQESRDRTKSVLRGPPPQLIGCKRLSEEHDAVTKTVRTWIGRGLQPSSIAVFGRTKRILDDFEQRLVAEGIATHHLSEKSDGEARQVRLGTMHRAKGLEFKAVVVAGCSEGQVPNAVVLADCSDPQDREDTEARERHLLYVAMTRARDELVIVWSGAPSPFLAPLLASGAPT